MKTLLLVKEIYVEGFEDLGNNFVKNFFKAVSVIGFGLFTMTLYAFIYRLSTGFAFA